MQLRSHWEICNALALYVGNSPPLIFVHRPSLLSLSSHPQSLSLLFLLRSCMTMDESGCLSPLRIGICFALLCCLFSAVTCNSCWGSHHSTASVVGANRGTPEPFLTSDLLYYNDGHASEFRCTAVRIPKQRETDKRNCSLLLPCNSSSHFAAFPSLQKQIQQRTIIKVTPCLLLPRSRFRPRRRHRHRHRPTITFSHRRQLNLDGTQMPTTSSLKPGFRRYAFIGSLLSSLFLFRVLRSAPSSIELKSPLLETLKNCRRPLLKALSTEKKEKSNKRKKKRSKQPNMVLLACSPKAHSSFSSSSSSSLLSSLSSSSSSSSSLSLSSSSMSDISPCESSSSIPSMKQSSGGRIWQSSSSSTRISSSSTTSSRSSSTTRESKGLRKGSEIPTLPSPSPPRPPALPEAISPISLGGMAITTTLLSTSSSRIRPEARAPGSSLLKKKGGFFSAATRKDERGFQATESDIEASSGRSNKEEDRFVYNIWGNHFAEINNHSALVSSSGLPSSSSSRSFFSRSEFCLSSHSLPSSPTFTTSDSLFSHHSPEFISTSHKPRILLS